MLKLHAVLLTFVTFGLVGLVGCVESSRSLPKPSAQPGTSSTEKNDRQPAQLTESTISAGSSTDSEIKVELTNFEDLQKRIGSFQDRVVVVDAWSTSCLPCMKEFPHLVELAKRWPEDVVCISINLDFAGLPNQTPKDCLPDVTKFLKAKSANLVNLVNLLSSETDEQMFARFEIESIPGIFVYDRAGALVSKLTVDTAGAGGLTYADDVIPLVETLIEK